MKESFPSVSAGCFSSPCPHQINGTIGTLPSSYIPYIPEALVEHPVFKVRAENKSNSK